MAEEETHVFDAARRVFSGEEAAQMGEAFARMKPSLGGEGFLVPTLDRLARMMPPRLRDSVRKFSTDNSQRHGLSTF